MKSWIRLPNCEESTELTTNINTEVKAVLDAQYLNMRVKTKIICKIEMERKINEGINPVNKNYRRRRETYPHNGLVEKE